MIAFRKSHPSLGRSRFWRDDVRWYGVGDAPDLSFDSHTLAFCLHGASQNDNDIYVMINAYWQALTFVVQEGEPQEWFRVVDTSLASPNRHLRAGDGAKAPKSGLPCRTAVRCGAHSQMISEEDIE